MISRRSLFALFGGVAVAPIAKALPAAAEPEPVYEWTEVSCGFVDTLPGYCSYGGIDRNPNKYWRTKKWCGDA